jgi:hypothetical protein
MAIPAVCARASVINTPGIMAFPGKCPFRKGSWLEKHFVARALRPGSTDVTSSIKMNGGRWGKPN